MLVSRGTIVAIPAEPLPGKLSSAGLAAVVIQDDRINRFSPLTIVVPAVSRRDLVDDSDPRAISLPPIESQEGAELVANCGSIFMIPTDRISGTLGRLSPDTMAKIDDALKLSLGLL